MSQHYSEGVDPMIAVDPNPYHMRHVVNPKYVPEDNSRIRPMVEDQILQWILIDYLTATVPAQLPGAEGLRICDLLREYPALSDSGIVPPQLELLDRFPELTEAIDRFFE